MRTVIAALVAFSVPAAAEPGSRVEVGGFAGVDYYGDEIGLGGGAAPEQRPQTAPTFGGRLTLIALRLGSDRFHLALGVEGEASFTAAWTGYGFDGPRPSYFAPVVGYKGHVLVRLGGRWLQPHVTFGGGGETVLSESPYMAKETDSLVQWGAGLTFPMADRWQLRFDARQGLAESIMGGSTLTYESHVSIGARIGVRSKLARAKRVEVVAPAVTEPPPRVADPPPAAPIAPPDRDRDGLVDASDKCPDVAEDMDRFEDDDGCADDDNDQDGIADARDACPLEPETKNGITDTDGCADAIPADLVAGLDAASATTFEKGRAALTAKGKAALEKAALVAMANPRIKLSLTVHPENADPKSTELATKRLNVVKFYLTEQGVAAGNLTTQVGAPVATKKSPLVTLAVSP